MRSVRKSGHVAKYGNATHAMHHALNSHYDRGTTIKSVNKTKTETTSVNKITCLCLCCKEVGSCCTEKYGCQWMQSYRINVSIKFDVNSKQIFFKPFITATSVVCGCSLYIENSANIFVELNMKVHPQSTIRCAGRFGSAIVE